MEALSSIWRGVVNEFHQSVHLLLHFTIASHFMDYGNIFATMCGRTAANATNVAATQDDSVSRLCFVLLKSTPTHFVVNVNVVNV